MITPGLGWYFFLDGFFFPTTLKRPLVKPLSRDIGQTAATHRDGRGEGWGWVVNFQLSASKIDRFKVGSTLGIYAAVYFMLDSTPSIMLTDFVIFLFFPPFNPKFVFRAAVRNELRIASSLSPS